MVYFALKKGGGHDKSNRPRGPFQGGVKVGQTGLRLKSDRIPQWWQRVGKGPTTRKVGGGVGDMRGQRRLGLTIKAGVLVEGNHGIGFALSTSSKRLTTVTYLHIF